MLFIVAVGGCDFMSHSRCEDEVLTKENSPDGSFAVVVSIRRCKTNSQFTSAALRENSMRATSDPEPVLVLQGIHGLKVHWQTSRDLAITPTGTVTNKEILNKRDRWQSVSIHFATTSP